MTLYCMNTSIFLFTASAARGQGMKKLPSNCRRFEGTVSIFSRKSLSVRQTRPSFVRTRTTTIRRIGGGRVSPARPLAGILLQKLLALRTRKTMERVFLENKLKGLLTMSLWIVTRTRFTRLQCVVLFPTSNIPRLLSGEEEH